MENIPAPPKKNHPLRHIYYPDKYAHVNTFRTAPYFHHLNPKMKLFNQPNMKRIRKPYMKSTRIFTTEYVKKKFPRTWWSKEVPFAEKLEAEREKNREAHLPKTHSRRVAVKFKNIAVFDDPLHYRSNKPKDIYAEFPTRHMKLMINKMYDKRGEPRLKTYEDTQAGVFGHNADTYTDKLREIDTPET